MIRGTCVPLSLGESDAVAARTGNYTGILGSVSLILGGM